MQTALTDSQLWQCLNEADARKSDGSLPIDVRVRSLQTYTLCLREAHKRGYDYTTMKKVFDGSEIAR
jgi:hypothetical protein